MIDVRASPETLKWKFMVVSRFAEDDERKPIRGTVALVTVHENEQSKNIEEDAIKSIGRIAEVFDLRELDKFQRRKLLDKVSV